MHQIAFMEPIVGRAQAAVSVSLMTTFAVIGRLTLGAVVDRLDPRQYAGGRALGSAGPAHLGDRAEDRGDPDPLQVEAEDRPPGGVALEDPLLPDAEVEAHRPAAYGFER
ncbi:hypothetical protein B4Q13_21365, partial [Lacticaseibacillus rhamnosus]